MFVNLYIMRHGEAENSAPTDQQRRLTTRGVEEVKQNARWLKKQIDNHGLDLIMVSPYIRALQTQQTVCELVDEPTKLDIIGDLIPDGNAENVHDYIDAAIQLYLPKNILVVSHMPLVSYLVEEFSFELATPIFPTAGIAYIKYDMKQMKGHFDVVRAP